MSNPSKLVTMWKQFEKPPPETTNAAHHPAHKLKLVTADKDDDAATAFMCHGCHEPGEGPRYRCGDCGSPSSRPDLHTRCALAEDTIKHPLFPDLTFKFLKKPLEKATKCDACGTRVHGFVYHCSETKKNGDPEDLDLHPCCATLPERIVMDDGRALELRKHTSRRCGICGSKGADYKSRDSFWVYRYGKKEDDMHVACLKERAEEHWAMAHENENHSGGSQMIRVGLESTRGLQQTSERSSGLENLLRIAGNVASIIIAVVTANPVALIGAIPKK